MAEFDWLSISGIIVDIILFLFVAGNAAFGYRRGLVRVIYSLCSCILALILVLILYKPVTNFIINNTSLSEKVQKIFIDNLGDLFDKENITSVQDIEQNDHMYNILNSFIGEEIGNKIENTRNSIIEYVSVQMSHKIIKVMTFFILFAVIRIILYVFKSYMEMLASVPIIRIFNGAGGMIYGIIRGFFLIYAIFAILYLIKPVIGDTIIITAIEIAPIGNKIFNNNIILNWIF